MSADFSALHLRDVIASPAWLIEISALLVTFLSVARVIYNLYFHPLRAFPGPKLFAATIIPQCWHWWKGDDHIVCKGLHEKYGEVVRVSPDSLSFIGAQPWKDIYGYGRAGAKQIPKDAMFYQRTGEQGISDLIFSNDTDHSRFRRVLSNAFSDKALRGSEPILNHYFNLLISRLKKRAASPETSTVDLAAWYNWTTFDIIGDLAAGEPFYALENEAYHPFITTFFRGIGFSTCFRILRNLKLEYPIYELVNALSKYSGTLRTGLLDMKRSWAKDILDCRLRPERKMQDRQDFLYHVLRQEDAKAMTRPELEKNTSLLIFAGSETTATFLSGTTYRLLKNPDILKELTDVVRGRFKNIDEITLASTVVSEMPYLHAVIEEGLRVYPPVPARLPRRTTEASVIRGSREYFVPAKTSIGVHQFSSSMCSDFFHNPTRFDPRRWMPSPPPEYAHDILDSIQPFSTGPRNCLGKNLAYGEMRCVLARMVWQFDFELDARSEGWSDQRTFTLWEKSPLWVKLRDRTEVSA